ncbi:hypothetical protein KY330_00545 [Candidatus Woesearchaeota archaeon]|nr:hypothetical protein [Candidatus Woesearchaeota archaeon]
MITLYDFLKSESLRELEQRYLSQGYEFSIEEAIEDWQKLKQDRCEKKVLCRTENLKVDGCDYHVHGICHSKYISEKHRDMFKSKETLWFYEENLGRHIDVHGIEVYDHALFDRDDVWQMSMEDDFSALELFFKSLRKKKADKAERSLGMPAEVAYSLPFYLVMDLAGGKVANLTGDRSRLAARSAFQAAFMKKFEFKDKSIVVGDAHRGPVKYFLKNGVKDGYINALADYYYELFMMDQKKYYMSKPSRELGYRMMNLYAVLWKNRYGLLFDAVLLNVAFGLL